MIAIRTSFHGPTHARGATIRAMCSVSHLTATYDHKLDLFQNHRAAFCALRDRMRWVPENGYPEAFAGDFGGDYYWVFAQPQNGSGLCQKRDLTR